MLITKNIDRLPILLSTEQVAALAAAVATRNAISEAVTAISGTPAHDGFVYVLWRIGQPALYVGSTLIKLRERFNIHRKASIKHQDRIVYNHIIANGGLVPPGRGGKVQPIDPSEDAFGILPIATCRVHGSRFSNPELGALERTFTEAIEPVLNDYPVALTPEEVLERQRESSQRRCSAKIMCGCGGRTDRSNKPKHERTQKHQRWLATCHTTE